MDVQAARCLGHASPPLGSSLEEKLLDSAQSTAEAGNAPGLGHMANLDW